MDQVMGMTTNIGTPAFLAPEMCNLEFADGANGQQQYSQAVDVYSFAILMWQVCEPLRHPLCIKISL